MMDLQKRGGLLLRLPNDLAIFKGASYLTLAVAILRPPLLPHSLSLVRPYRFIPLITTNKF